MRKGKTMLGLRITPAGQPPAWSAETTARYIVEMRRASNRVAGAEAVPTASEAVPSAADSAYPELSLTTVIIARASTRRQCWHWFTSILISFGRSIHSFFWIDRLGFMRRCEAVCRFHQGLWSKYLAEDHLPGSAPETPPKSVESAESIDDVGTCVKKGSTCRQKPFRPTRRRRFQPAEGR